MRPTGRQVSDFEYFLRTGRRVTRGGNPRSVGFKFNPWHDPGNGRFTFRNSGEYWPGDGFGGFGGGGGGFNGGGAGGNWEPPVPKPKPVRAPTPKADGPQPSTIPESHERNGFQFKVDGLRRPTLATGELKLDTDAGRSRRLQRATGGSDRRSSDDGGHFIAPRFNGPREWFNHFAQDRNFNRGGYREMEREWGKQVAAGRRVFVDIRPRYDGNSQRPSKIIVYWTVNGRRKRQSFHNERGGKPNGG